MSAQDQHIEQPHASHVSASPSPSRRDVGDADTFTRKRQRLDDGDAVMRAMSTDPDSPSKVITSPHKEMVAMTIQEHTAPSPSPAADVDSDHIATKTSTDQKSEPPITPAMMDGASDGHTSPPLVEVVVSDDDDDDYDRSDNLTVHLDAESYFQDFPYHDRFGSALRTLRGIMEHLHNNLAIPPDLLPLLVQWLDGLPDDSSHLHDFFLYRASFWIEFADLIERLLKRRYHWMNALDAGQDDDLSRYPLGDAFDDTAVDETFSTFFSAYMRLCSQLLTVDIQILNEPRSDDQHISILISEKHMYHLLAILRSEKLPLFHVLRRHHEVDVRDLSNRLHTDFLTANGGQNLLRLADEILHNVPSNFQDNIAICICQLLGALGWTVCRVPDAGGGISPAEFYRGTLLFIQKYIKDLEDTAKVTDGNVAKAMISCFSSLIQELSQWDETSKESLMDTLLDAQAGGSPTDSSPIEVPTDVKPNDYRQYTDSLPVVLANTWKFNLLRRYLVKGKMELRIMSIGSMDEALVELYKEYNGPGSIEKHPVLKHLADVLLRGRVVDYILSVDSHPQLLSRSGNVLGFLLVTDRWSDRQADSVWNIVSSSPDPRMVSATMAMLEHITQFMKSKDDLYFCLKLYELPIASYNTEILSFFRNLTEKLLVPQRIPMDWDLRDETARPWNVCVRLLQHTAPKFGATKHEIDVGAEIDDLLLHRVARYIPEPDQCSIYRRCLEEIAARSDKATGSVRVILILGRALKASFLQQDKNIGAQILGELSRFIEVESEIASYEQQLPALQYRLELLRLLICECEQSISQGIYKSVWDHIVGPQALSNDARDVAWTALWQATRRAPDNDFCRQLISDYVPAMDPNYFTIGLYNFVANYKFPLSRTVIQIDGVERSLLQIPGGDLLWSLALSSPPGTIEEQSASDLAVRYTQIPQSPEIFLSDVETAHVELVERCMNELRSAFAALQKKPNQDRQGSEIRFNRMLMFLKKVLQLVRQRPEFNRARRADSKVESMDMISPPNDTITIKYQFGNDKQSLQIPADRTIADLYQTLCHATKCTKINLFAGGQKLDVLQRADQKIADARFGGHLLIQAIIRDETAQAISAPVAGCSEFETNLVKHFDEMFAWLDQDDTSNQLLFDFLTSFPYRSTITNGVAAGDATFESLFPPGKPFQARYAVQGIHSKLKDQLRGSALDESFLSNAIKLLSRALLDTELLGDDTSFATRLPLTAVLVSAMSDFLRERPSFEVSKDYFSDETALANRLMTILVASMRVDAAKITQECYNTIVEASMHSSVIWNTIWEHSEALHVHRELLLTDTRETLRSSIKLKILSICGGHLPSACPLSAADISVRYWETIADILPRAVEQPDRSDQLLELAQHVFRVYDEHHRSEGNLRSLLQTWSSLLVSYSQTEVPGRYEVDHVVLGFTKLLMCLLPSLKSFKHPLNSSELISALFQKFLFTSAPPVETVLQGHRPTSSSVPVLDSSSRRELYDLMLALADDSHSYGLLLRLVVRAENKSEDNTLPVSVDRTNEIRSRTGYVGLYNPRAICYMNSLLTQLFMNVNFRQFMLGLEVKEGDGSQRLLLETQKLFASLQESYRRSVDPRPFAECVQTLDKTPIDITVQMDADEFYNLLFDQWEAQLLTQDDKRQFRNFYGGKMLQQVKSKECKHVSEREDSFFALQCDVQGKTNLQESLQAFVQGDVMEGDNKYKCESCGGKFVDAVKRTCLKSAPDNLIFHLKRFDFDLTDFSRRKVNEHFAFPDSIDIGLYNVNHLSNPLERHTEDFFDLVGVVVHFGTCENGHYYSYIRKRPDPSGDGTASWLNFNDEQVDPFDPSEIPQKAFGGPVENSYNRQYKMYSAYMLFYQRRSAIATDQERWAVSSQAEPLKVNIPQQIKEEIDLNNDSFIQEYCLFDPYHSAFVRHLHGASRKINNGSCSENHQHEKLALAAFLAHLGSVVWRHQTSGTFEEALNHLRRTVLSCKTCCSITLQWLTLDDEVLHNLILRCPHPAIRSQTGAFLVDCIRVLRDKDAHLYDTVTDTDSASEPETDTGIMGPLAKRLLVLAENSYRGTRAWDDFYMLLTHIAEMGRSEAAALLDAGILVFCLRLFCLHIRSDIADNYVEFQRVFTKRFGVYNRLVGFMATIISRMDLNLEVCNSPDRLGGMNRATLALPFSDEEKQLLLSWHRHNKAYAVIDKMTEVFDQTKTETYYPGGIVKWMMETNDDSIQEHLVTMLVQGINELNNPFCDPYLGLALNFCKATASRENLGKIFNAVVEAVATADVDNPEKSSPSGGAALRFFRQLYRLDNQYISSAETQSLLIAGCHRYANVLLLYSDGDVRIEAQDFIRDLFVKYMEEPQHLNEAYRGARATAREMFRAIMYGMETSGPRRRLQPLLETGQFIISLLSDLVRSEDPAFADLKDEDDMALLHEWTLEIETRVRAIPDGSFHSPVEGMFDSDYASDSDDMELLDR